MTRSLLRELALALTGLALAACSETSTPTQPGADADKAPTAEALSGALRNSWTEKARHPDRGLETSSGRIGHAAGVANDASGRPHLYVFGGITADFENHWTTTETYDLATDKWTTSGGIGLAFTNGVGKIGSKLYISGGGYFATSDGAQIVSSLYAYEPATGRLTRKAEMPRPTANGVSAVINDKLYVLAGMLAGRCDTLFGIVDCTNFPTRRFYRYDPRTDSWATRPWSPHVHVGGVGGVIDGNFYVTGGSADLDVYDAVANTWTTRAPMPEARTGAAGAVLGGRLYVIGGCGASGCDKVFAYDPVTNTWRTKANLPTPKSDLAAGRMTLDGKSYILAVAGSGDDRTYLYTP